MKNCWKGCFRQSKLQNFLPLPIMVADRTFGCIPIDRLEFEMIQNDSKCYFQHWGAQSWFGLVNQVVWAHPINEIMQSFRKFIKPNSKFLWTAELQKLFNDTKALIISKVEQGMQTFNTKRQTCIESSWS